MLLKEESSPGVLHCDIAYFPIFLLNELIIWSIKY